MMVKTPKRRQRRIVFFESEPVSENSHITKEETFEVAHSMYETLYRVCPGCSMGVLSMLISMLTIHYTEEELKLEKIFDRTDWYKYIMDAVDDAVSRYERKESSTVN
jgi:hypothetical protein